MLRMYLRPTDVREANIRRVFQALLARPNCSRAELARLTGLSGVTAGRVVDAMVELGLIEDVDPAAVESAPPAMGRPPQLIALAARPRFLGIEIGVHQTTFAALPLANPGSAPDTRIIATPKSVGQFLTGLKRAQAALGMVDAEAIVVSVPGVVDQRTASVLVSPNLHWTEGEELLSGIAAIERAPVIPVQEVQALALGHQAAGETVEHFLLLDLAEGVGGAVVMQGRLLAGEVALSGELGHTPVMDNDRRCGCGAIGCLETLASRDGLLRSYRETYRRRIDWRQLSSHVTRHGIEPWLDQAIDAVGGVVAGAINLLGLGHVIVTGDLPSLHPAVIGRLQASIQEHSLLGRFGRVSCTSAPRRRWLGLVVAASDLVLGQPSVDRRSLLPLAI